MRDLATKVDGTSTLSASDFNANLGLELENFVTDTDQTLDAAGGPDTGGLEMMGKAAAAYAGAGAVYQDSGAANAYVLAIASNLKSITKYFTGLRVTFKPGNTNTGASTVNIATIGVKDITLPDGTALSAGMIIDGEYITLIYNLSDDRFEISVLTQKAVKFESLDLIINVQSNTTVDADAKRLSLLNSANIPAYIDDLDVTWIMPTHLEGGTSEKPSHWYGLWTDSDGNLILAPDLTGTTDGTTSGKLVDSGATLQTDVVHAGDIVYNLTDLTQTTVSVDASAEGEVSLTDDIFVSGEDYKIVKMSPVGLGANRERVGAAYNNSGSNFDDSTYAQIQEERDYNGDGTDFTITSSPAVSSLIRAKAYIRQTNDWTGKGTWKINFNVVYDVASGSRAVVTMTISGIVYKNVAGFDQPITGVSNSAIADIRAYASANTANVFLNHVSATTDGYHFSADVECDKKPTFHN